MILLCSPVCTKIVCQPTYIEEKMLTLCSSKRGKIISYDHNAFNGDEDLIWEILFHLPPKHVLRFKCVSKTWYSIISNPTFLRNHSLRFHHHHFFHEFLLLPQDDGEDNDLVLNLLDHDSPDKNLALSGHFPITGVLPVFKDSEFTLVSTCNGLLLYVDDHKKEGGFLSFRCLSFFTINDYYEEESYYVCNPVTKNYVNLPNLITPLFESNKRTCFIKNLDTHILFDPSVSLSYQVIRFLCRNVTDGFPESDVRFELYVYSSAEGSWRLSAITYRTFAIQLMMGVLLNGVIYWITCGSDLCCFDAEKNSIWFQPLPPKPEPDFKRKCFYFGECGGRLCLIEKYCYEGNFLTLYDGFDIMEMAVEDGTWTKKYHVNLEEGNNLHLLRTHIMILHVYNKTRNKFKEEEEEETVLLMKIDETMVSFSLKSNTFFGKELTIPNSNRPVSCMDVYPYFITPFPL